LAQAPSNALAVDVGVCRFRADRGHSYKDRIDPAGDPFVRLVNASSQLAAPPGTALLQRYETRLQNMYSRAIRTFKVLRTIPVPELDDPPNIEFPKEPSPIPEHPAPEVKPSPAIH
jgi:hypothetical protein